MPTITLHAWLCLHCQRLYPASRPALSCHRRGAIRKVYTLADYLDSDDWVIARLRLYLLPQN